MDRLVTDLEQLTQQGLAELVTMDAERLGAFMEQRSNIMTALLQVTSTSTNKEAYKDRIQAVLSLDPIFLRKLEQFRDEASSQLTKLDTGKIQRNAYDTHYDPESYFFDRKK
ncbi:hypothetical protein GCM10008018_49930 [Paenibacillus marchantiophytorum]|uniref:Flagellar protein FliT n=1 Tax=Paenibacillus marchantiophytorum TaxID=1619310 RepID=A0ABQ1F328_9BACL|nr:hypothetical protein [Paenibacillus marchantiophytorum]GFZ97679.1 hypothetical protein GCM10008018_49930 [Paenibacillus marchantiophytorum]